MFLPLSTWLARFSCTSSSPPAASGSGSSFRTGRPNNPKKVVVNINHVDKVEKGDVDEIEPILAAALANFGAPLLRKVFICNLLSS